jgi:N6-L-threonylcarbamoyladenine synthase
LAKKLNLPIIPINHIEAHIFASLFQEDLKLQAFSRIFPAIALVVSGGHTQLILARGLGKYKILGETRDDAAGECFDKIARTLGLDYPGGPAIEKQASKVKKAKNKMPIKMPRPMIYQKNYDFSFSGLKTAALYNFKKQKPKVRKSKGYIESMSKEVQQAIIDVLIRKTIKAAKDYRVKSIILGGGVTANKELRRQFKKKIKKDLPDTRYYIPDNKYSTDNALMIAVTAYFYWVFGKKIDWKKVTVNANLRI